ncbi:slit homolog 3 protein-like [Pecten maximus]|uniref:slit homolog 3 protein-like n=1 Tax=Pecten maximus TaxID=6579 RepID=UPI001458604F|nr:slit homolog 3 protein-like [Pecten maximus]
MSELHPLDVEYTTIRGSSVLSGRYDIKSKLEHEAGYLDAIPDNICQYQLLVYVDLSGNNIKEIGNISCLTKLDTLDLSENQLSFIYNHTFRGLVSLRKLNLANNKISYIEPYTWSHQTSSILNIQLEGNELSEVDMTNIIINRPFCMLDYRNNHIKDIVSEAGWTLTADDEIVKGGYVNLTDNKLSGVIDFLYQGVSDLKVLGKIFSTYAFDMRDAPFQCDCIMEPFLKMVESNFQTMWRSYYEQIKCFYPEELRNKVLAELVRNKQYDLFICDIPQSEGCPYNCNCYKQPSRDRVVVNCSGHGLDQIPQQVPRTDLHLEIYLDNNSISTLEWRGYLNQTRKLVLSNNSITTMEGRAVNQLQNATEVDLRGNTGIIHLPEDIRYLKPSIFIFGELTIVCDCSNTWYGEWIKMHKNEKGHNMFWCHTENNVKEAPEVVTKEFLDCSKPSMLSKWITVALAILTSLILGISLIVKVFKYEIYLLFRTLRNKYKTYPDMYYDVYVSYDETTDEINKWIMNGLLPALEQDGYRVCIPARDFNVGVPHEDEIADFMGRSKFVLMLVSKNEKNVFWDLEWKRAWYSYTSYKIQNIILINFDMAEYDCVTHPVLRAFIRLGMCIDFANMDQSLIQDIKKMLGFPTRKKIRLENEFSNCNTRFKRSEMLMNR